MSTEIFVDASAWIALADAGDKYHKQATAVYPTLLRRYRRLVTTSLVVAEAHILIRRELGHAAAMAFLTGLRTSARIYKFYASAALEAEAERLLLQYSDQEFSLTDAVSFALMREQDITEAFTFDSHFAAAGFIVRPPL